MARMNMTKGLIVGALLGVPLVALVSGLARAAEPAVVIPPPTQDAAPAAAGGMQTVVLAGGCFWGMQAVYEHTKGVTQAVSGYAGGQKDTAHYQTVSTGTTGHAEIGFSDVRSARDFLRKDSANLLFRGSQPDRA